MEKKTILDTTNFSKDQGEEHGAANNLVQEPRYETKRINECLYFEET